MGLIIDGDVGDFVHTVITECAVVSFYDELEMNFYTTKVHPQLSEEDFIIEYLINKIEACERIKAWRAEHETR